MEKLAGNVACGADSASRQRGMEGERWKGVTCGGQGTSPALPGHSYYEAAADPTFVQIEAARRRFRGHTLGG